jgi:hypothetical protein
MLHEFFCEPTNLERDRRKQLAWELEERRSSSSCFCETTIASPFPNQKKPMFIPIHTKELTSKHVFFK